MKPGPGAGILPLRSELPLLALLLAAAALVRLVVFIGYQGHDDRTYIAYAHLYATGGSITQTQLADPWISRVGGWLPLAWSMSLFGNSEYAMVLYSLLCSLGTVVLGYLFGRRYLGRFQGVMIAGFLILLPLDVLYATRPFADEAVGFWMVLAYYLLLTGEADGNRLAMLLGGVAAGIAYLTKETSLLLLLPLLIHLVLEKRLTSHRFIWVAGIVLVFAAEAGFWLSATGDPLFRTHTMLASRAHFVPAPPAHRAGGILDLLPGPKPEEVFRSNNTVIDAVMMFATNEEFGLLYYLVWPLVLYFTWTRDKVTRPFRIWLLLIALFLLFFPFHFPSYTLNRDPRYYTCLSIAALFVLVRWLAGLRPAWRWTIAGGLALSWLPCLYVGYVSSQMNVERQVVGLHNRFPAETLWVSNRLAADVMVLSGFDTRIPLGVQWLEETYDGGPGLSGPMRSMKPASPVAYKAGDIRQGLVVLDEKLHIPPEPGWTPALRLTPEHGPVAELVQRCLRGLHVPETFVRKVMPSQSDVKLVYRAG